MPPIHMPIKKLFSQKTLIICTTIILLAGCSATKTPSLDIEAINAAPVKKSYDSFCLNTKLDSNLSGTKLCGIDKNDIVAFHGIEYAKAKRWQPPHLYDYELTVTNAEHHGPFCPQNSKISRPIGPNGLVIEDNEDCLNMNIWTPKFAIKTHQKLPVVVFIHGGAFVLGSGSQNLYDGANFAKHGMVFITVNYRLGILGFLHPEGKNNMSGNYGLMDQQTAIQWVRNNISQFGGNPDNITLMGESAGAMSIGIYLSNYDKDTTSYITGAIMESNPYGAPYKSNADALIVRNKYQDHACNIFTSNCDLNTFSTQALLKLQNSLSSKLAIPFKPKYLLTFEPYIDDQYLKSQPINTRISIPLLMGTNENKANLFVGMLMKATTIFGLPLINKLTYQDIEAKLFPKSYMNQIKKMPRYTAGSQYIKGAKKTSVFDAMSNLFTDAFFLCPSREVMRNASSTYKYSYVFKYVSENHVMAGMTDVCNDFACHASELPFVFNNALTVSGKPITFTEHDKKIAHYMHRSWANFITATNHKISPTLMRPLGANLGINTIENIWEQRADLNQAYSPESCKVFKGLYQTKDFN